MCEDPVRKPVARLVFKSDRSMLMDVAPKNCELVVTVYNEGAWFGDGDLFSLEAEVVDAVTGGSDGWYDFVEFVSDVEAFESLGVEQPECAIYEVGLRRYVFNSQESAIEWAKRFADDGLAAEFQSVSLL